MENQDTMSTVNDVPAEIVLASSTPILEDIRPVENQTHHSVLTDHQLEVDGVIYRELKTLNRVVIQVFLQII